MQLKIERKAYHDHVCYLEYGSQSNLPKLFLKPTLRQRITRHIKKSMLIYENHPLTKIYFRSSDQIIAERIRQIENYGTTINHPYSKFNLIWAIIMVFVLLVHLIMEPFALLSIHKFSHHQSIMSPILLALTMLTTALLIFDIFVGYRTGYYDEKKQIVVLDGLQILYRYTYRYLKIKFFDAVPVVLKFYLYTIIQRDNDYRVLRIIYVILVVVGLIYGLIRYIELTDLMQILLARMKISGITQKVISLIVIFVLTQHFLTCVHGWLPALALFIDDPKLDEHAYRRQLITKMDDATWQLETELSNHPSDLYKYMRLLCMTMQLTLGGGYVIQHNLAFWHLMTSVTIVLFGFVFFTVIKLLIIRLILANESPKEQFERALSNLKQFSQMVSLPKSVIDDLDHYYRYKFKHRYFNENAIKSTITKTLLNEIQVYECKNLFHSVPFFRFLPPLIVDELVGFMQRDIYLPRDVIIHARTSGESLHFIAAGTARVISTSGKHLGFLTDGSYFGEISLLVNNQLRTATVVAVELSEVYMLSKKDFHKVIAPYPHLLYRMELMAVRRLKSLRTEQKRKDMEVLKMFF